MENRPHILLEAYIYNKVNKLYSFCNFLEKLNKNIWFKFSKTENEGSIVYTRARQSKRQDEEKSMLRSTQRLSAHKDSQTRHSHIKHTMDGITRGHVTSAIKHNCRTRSKTTGVSLILAESSIILPMRFVQTESVFRTPNSSNVLISKNLGASNRKTLVAMRWGRHGQSSDLDIGHSITA